MKNIEAVVLAAGYSSRAGAFKPGLDLGGKTVIERCLEGMLPLCDRVIVVGGYQIERLYQILAQYPSVEIVLNRRYVEGMFSSVKVGMSQAKAERILFTPGDHPLISQEVCRSLLRVDGDIVIPTFNGRKGHPVLLTRQIAQEILLENDDSNLRDYIQKKGYQTLAVTDEGILIDLDTKEDYQRIVERVRLTRGRG
ncbi:MAG TPA: molybdopterin-guanine dinucleotide biosynthesis protein A [Firmicutes bacterium]|jgi:molybdenum cofactor cytidylyltransferase|nr:molybdopterin-guanine dinucleotide biosynthesis protein A [Bacillota bacterium]